MLIDEKLGDKDALQHDQIRLQLLKQEYSRFSKATGLPMRHERMEAAGFDWKKGKAAEKEYIQVAKRASEFFNLGSTEANVAAYTKEKNVIDTLASHGVKYIKRISN